VQTVTLSGPEAATVGEWRSPLFARCANGLLAISTAACLATTTEVVVAGVTGTHHVPLKQADRFEPHVVETGIANGTPMIVLLRHGADPIGVYALSRQLGFVWNFKKMLDSLEPEARVLNLSLARARNGGA
jgi:hypothetical protein